MIRKERVPFVFIALASLVIGLLAGLIRLGWNLGFPNAVPHHGAIMVGGFLGTLIILEKIIPLKKDFLYAIPVVSGLSVVMFLMGGASLGFILLIIAGVALSAVFLVYMIRSFSLIYIIMFAGAVLWLIGNIELTFSNFYPRAFPWWMGFALLIIAAERLELMKFLPVTEKNKLLFTLLLAGFIAGCLLSFHGTGSMISGFSLCAIALWLMRFDVIGLTIKKTGLTKFTAIALLTGYFALLITGMFMIVLDAQPFAYDAIVHTFFIGFVFSMIFAHGPIILPGVLGVSTKPFNKILYIWLGMLHASLAVRLAGDLYLELSLRKYSGIGSAIAITGYFITVALLLFNKRKRDGKIF